MFHTSRDHKYFPRLQDYISVAQLNIQRAVYDQEHLVGVPVGVPNEFAQEFGKLDLVII